MDSLIYDRTEEDVEYALENPDSSEYLKGAYNYTDLNRLEEYCAYFKIKLKKIGYDTSEIKPKVSYRTYEDLTESKYQEYIDSYDDYFEMYYESGGWSMIDIPYQDAMDRIQNNIEILIDMFSDVISEFPVIPDTWDYTKANALEKTLYLIYNYFEIIYASQPYCGDLYCEEE